jgi:hypothetical protein
MAAKIPFLSEAVFRNESAEPIELMIPADQSARVSHPQEHVSYIVHSPAEALETIVLLPAMQIELL